MSNAELMSPPEIPSAAGAPTKWQNEREAFRAKLTSLLPSHKGKYVAIHEGKVVDSGEDRLILAVRAYQKFGYVPIYVGYVSADSAESSRQVRVPSPRRLTSTP